MRNKKMEIEKITWKGQLFVYLIRSEYTPLKTSFITGPQGYLQTGFIVYSKGQEIPKHFHKPIKRHIDRTEEILIVRKGKAGLNVYNAKKEMIAALPVRQGDVILLVSGGHGFRVVEDLILQEIKQGPYTGLEEKERF